MFGASHFQKELSERTDFCVSYCRNKFLDYKLTTSWLDYYNTKLTDQLMNWLYKLVWLTADWMNCTTYWLHTDRWLHKLIDYKWTLIDLTNQIKLLNTYQQMTTNQLTDLQMTTTDYWLQMTTEKSTTDYTNWLLTKWLQLALQVDWLIQVDWLQIEWIHKHEVDWLHYTCNNLTCQKNKKKKKIPRHT